MLDQLARVARLYDFYGPLLTSKQRRWLELHYHYDYSLGEIAREVGISRQAVNDGLRRAIKSLEEYEASLGFVQRDLTMRKQLTRAKDYIANYLSKGCEDDLHRALGLLQQLLMLPEGSVPCQGQSAAAEKEQRTHP
ncbi:MAG: YlxM family DNA-binding protein [Clostridia bacterium]|nr:YlxM family DNA-binding protein [Clostridia bacterium]